MVWGKEIINSVKEHLKKYRLGGITLCEGKRQNELGSFLKLYILLV